jgi:hypothetical protein
MRETKPNAKERASERARAREMPRAHQQGATRNAGGAVDGAYIRSLRATNTRTHICCSSVSEPKVGSKPDKLLEEKFLHTRDAHKTRASSSLFKSFDKNLNFP